ncbi:unnamed protein product [Calypogeia fissa]
MAAAAASSVIILAAASAGVGWQRMSAANKVGDYVDKAPSPSTGQSSAARAAMGTVTKEPVTGIEFPNTLTPPGASTELALVGAGVREKKIAFFKVKVYAVGFYIDASSLVDTPLSSWKGKSGSELSKDEAFFKALMVAPVEKALRIVLARDVDGSQFWGALDEALAPRLKTAGAAGQEALTKFGNVFKDLALKQGTSVLLTWSQPATMQVAVDGSSNSATPDATIESAALLFSTFDVYLGKDTVSPSATADIANNFPSLL